MKVLILAAHPDDEVLGCGGTAAKLAQEGASIHLAILGEGATSRSAKREQAAKDAVQGLRQSAAGAARILGVQSVSHFGLPDNRFDSVDLLDIVKIIEEMVHKVNPQWVFTQHGGDLNIDHTLVFRATLTAVRPPRGSGVEALYAYEVPSSTEWSFQRFEPAFRPNFFFGIADTLETKINAMAAYESEAREFPHPRSPDALRSIARRWGSVAGINAAEAFELIRGIRP